MPERIYPGPEGFRRPEEEPKRGRGRSKWNPSDDTRKLVENMAGIGMTIIDIAIICEVEENTLRNNCLEEIERGRAMMNAVVMGKLYEQIKANNYKAIEFWLKTRCGWYEAKTGEQAEAEAMDELSDEQLVSEIESLRNKTAVAARARGLAAPV